MYGLLQMQLTELAMKNIREDQQGFNSVYMMLDSGAGDLKNKFVS
jgi:DNA-directed RNA polymerase subunit beta'